MAASILAKTARDRLMEYYGIFYPQYGYEKHKGYPTKAHREAIMRFGPSPIQRMSFRVKL
jgi:ribonuclease HII